MRFSSIALAIAAIGLSTGLAKAEDLPARSDIEAVCDKFGPTNKEFCGLMLGVYDAVDGLDSRLSDIEAKLDRIPEHPHPAFGYEATQDVISDLRADMESGLEELDGKIGRVPEHPHPAFGYEATKAELAEIRAAIEQLKAQ